MFRWEQLVIHMKFVTGCWRGRQQQRMWQHCQFPRHQYQMPILKPELATEQEDFTITAIVGVLANNSLNFVRMIIISPTKFRGTR